MNITSQDTLRSRLLPASSAQAVFAAQVLWSASAATGATIFAQTPASNISGAPTDNHFDADGREVADDFTIATATTARSLTWRGFYAALGNSPAFPLSFTLKIYGNNGSNLPDIGNVLSTTSISFASAAAIVDTGINSQGNFDVYEYRANLTPTALAAGTKYWLSIFADMSNDSDDDWNWTSEFLNGMSAVRDNVIGNGTFAAAPDGPVYFIVDDAPVPEPASLALLAGGALPLVRRRKR